MPIEQVISSLKQMNEAHRVLLQLGEKKTEVIKNNQVDELNRIVSAENRLLKQIADCETARENGIKAFFQQKGFSMNASMTITELAKWLTDVTYKHQLQQEAEALSGTITELKHRNELNQQLIRHSLQFIDFALDLYSGPSDQEVVYGNPMMQQKSLKNSKLFDSRA